MPISFKVVSEKAYTAWLTQAKKDFAFNDTDGVRTKIATTRGAAPVRLAGVQYNQRSLGVASPCHDKIEFGQPKWTLQSQVITTTTPFRTDAALYVLDQSQGYRHPLPDLRDSRAASLAASSRS